MVAQLVKNPPAMQNLDGFLGQEDLPWRSKWQPTSWEFLPGKSHGQGAWQGTAHGVTKESDMTD